MPEFPRNQVQVRGTLTNSTSGEVLGKNLLLNITGAGGHEEGGIISVGTTEQTLDWNAFMEGFGYVWLENQDATNYIQVGIAVGVYFARLLPGDFALFPHNLDLGTLYLKANTAACNLKYKAYEI